MRCDIRAYHMFALINHIVNEIVSINLDIFFLDMSKFL